MRIFFSTFLILLSLAAVAQNTRELRIVTPATEKVVSIRELGGLKSHLLDSVRIYNHAGVYRSTLQGITGVSLKDVLKDIPLGEESPKVLSRYYIVCGAEDGYQVVLSWNEVFNTPVGDSVLVVTGIKNRGSEGDTGSLALLSPKDYATGRRYVKQLNRITVLRVDL